MLYVDNLDFLMFSVRCNEMIGWLNEGLNDVSISRINFKWGISMSDDEKYVIYVWIDVLMNYIIVIGFGDGKDFIVYVDWFKYWFVSMYIMVKEIFWFYSVIWFAFFMAFDLSFF